MHLNIKNDTAHALAKELAAITGRSLTEAVTLALESELSRRKSARGEKASPNEMMAYIRSLNIPKQKPGDDELSVTHGDLLYDEYGLPK